ncbi:class I SAM-dependent methyltransferase [Campylobacter mucosalis]|uniref:class I SAM-dependent methyltransferase n=1 Tax=Campylobacter mucosalis TaxID=202 RepID=UPI001470436E|nr:class I SAM-dependent methyltransferase [Campylobacter mucosalis]
MQNNFNNIHDNGLDGWGFSFRRSQLFRFKKYIEILKRYNIKGNILEIGCSTGFFTNILNSSLKEINLTAVDISEVAIDKAKAKYPSIKFSIDSLPNLNFKKNTLDCVMVIEMLYYLDDTDKIKSIDKIYNILNKNSGGYILVSVNIGEKPYFKLDEIRKLVSSKFNIICEDGLYIKSYYKYIEIKIWMILELFSSYNKFKIKGTDTALKKVAKNTINLFVKNKFTFFTIGFIIKTVCKILLFCMPINLINAVSKVVSKKEQSIYICLGKKK